MLAIERFMRRVEVRDSCWEWRGATTHDGYGKFFDRGNYLAHRWSYIHHVGPVPSGLELDHLCRNRRCANPEHLEPVTRQENARRGDTGLVNNHNAVKTHCRRGHEYTEANTYVWRGSRHCRECGRLRQKGRVSE